MNRKKSFRSSSDIPERPIAASWNCAVTSEPSKFALSAPSFPLERIGDENPLAIHYEAKVDPVLDLPEYVADGRIHKKLPDLVLYRRYCFRHEAGIVLLKFVDPKGSHQGVLNLFDHASAKVRIREHARQPEQGHAFAVQKRCERVVEDIFKARPP